MRKKMPMGRKTSELSRMENEEDMLLCSSMSHCI